MKLIHDLLTELRKQVKVIETDFFSLIGEEFDDLQVISRADRRVVISGAETYIAAWKCHCTCGQEAVINHNDLIEKKHTNCGGEAHSEIEINN